MEKFNYTSATSIAKSIGTLVSVIGALIVTLYQGPSILGISSHSDETLTSSSAWLIGGLLLTIDSLVASIFIIAQALFGNVFQVSIIMWCVRRKGPLFASVFHPLGVIFATTMGIVILGEAFYLGSLLGSIVVVIGFYFVMWGKAKEAETIDDDGLKGFESRNEKKMPLLLNNTAENGVV
ncbi:hypothetical protein MIMGU_mgv11b0196341mg, partial [Erythranthe guttata]